MEKFLKNDLIEDIQEDEKILWHSYPKQGFQLVFEDLLIIPFLIFVGFVAFYFLYLSKGIFLIAFISLFYTIYKRYSIDINNRKSTQYFITAKRVIIDNPKNGYSIPFGQITKISYIEHPFNYVYSSIIFGEEVTIFGKVDDEPFKWSKLLFNRGGGIELSRDETVIAFIKNGREPYNLIMSKITETKLSKEIPICQ